MTKQGKNVSMYLVDGNVDGIIKATITGWDGEAYKIPCMRLRSFKSYNELKESGILFLFGIDYQSSENVVLIEQTIIHIKEDAIDLLDGSSTNVGTDYWKEAIIITFDRNLFDLMEIRYIETRLCNIVREANRYKVRNSSKYAQNSIAVARLHELEKFVDEICLIVELLGYKIFKQLDKRHSILVNDDAIHDNHIFYFKTKRICAMGIFTKDGFMMLKGSRIEPVISKSCPNNVVEQRQNYTEHISDNILTSNILLTSPSAAAAFASGSSRNGNISWKTAEGITLGRFEEWLSLEKTHEHISGNNKTK